MTNKPETSLHWPKSAFPWLRSISLSIAAKLMWSFLLIIAIISTIFMFVGNRLIGDRLVVEAQEKVRNDLNTAREIYLENLNHINDAVRYTADRSFLRNALQFGNIEEATDELVRVKEEAGLDVLAVTDQYGYVVLRTDSNSSLGDNQGTDELVRTALYRKTPQAATIIVSADELYLESPALAEAAYFKFIDTPLAREREEVEERSGMMLKAAAPIFDDQKRLIGTVYGGVLLSRNYAIVDKIKQTVYQDVIYEGQDIGTSTIFLDDLRISTNVKNKDGSRAIGTRVSEEVYNQVVIQGEPWIARAFVVNSWYIAAYEPISDINNRIIGILYVGIVEQKYTDTQRQTLITFTGITLAGGTAALILSYFIAQRILVPINKLVDASQEVALGNLDFEVKVSSNDELQSLANSFNIMNKALKRRDEQLKDFATQRIMESERLALVGQLSANIAHELNNPLQGIITFANLLLEDHKYDGTSIVFPLEKIVGQANRCRDIIRGLLDFSRQRKPDKTLCSVNEVLHECASLVEHQALFHNIEVIKHFQDSLPLAVIDAAQIERVFINMIINAAEAMEGSGYLNISTRYSKRKDAIEIAFSDSGSGISEENLKKIFDPFFTTKDVGHGTGLGLAISYGIVKGHGGSISAQSELGRGTTFIVTLPTKATEINGEESKHA
ncbi:MAG: cache domain-containing protein [Anaerolineae bacterium]|nr:cache domain-containing protein [Anaerolineae bacterium]